MCVDDVSPAECTQLYLLKVLCCSTTAYAEYVVSLTSEFLFSNSNIPTFALATFNSNQEHNVFIMF